MATFDKFLGLASMSGIALERLLLKRFLLGMAAILLLGFIIAVLFSALVVAGLYLAYRLLIEHGMEPDSAIWLVAGITAAIIIALIAIAVNRLHKLRNTLIPRRGLASKATEIVEAFIDGLLAPSGRNRQY